MNNLIFYRPSAIILPDTKISFPVFHFTEELRQLASEINWTIIGKPVAMLDCHIAQCYGKCTRNFNLQVERNREYFKSDWRFQPTLAEWTALKYIVNKQVTDAVAKCNRIHRNKEDQVSEETDSTFSLSQIFGAATKSSTLPWFYTKKGIDMAAFFQSTPIARMRAIYIVEIFNELEEATFDPATNPRVQNYILQVLEKKLPKTPKEIAEQFEASRKMAEAIGLRGNQAILSATIAVKKQLGIDPLELLGQKQLICEPQEVLLAPTAIGKMLDISAQKVNKLLEEAGMQTSYREAKNKKCWKPTEKGKPFAVIMDANKKHSDGRPIQQLMWRESIVEILKEFAKKKLLF